MSVHFILDKSNKLISIEIDDPLRNFLCEMSYRNLLVIRSHGLVCKQWEFDDVFLLHRLLRVYFILILLCCGTFKFMLSIRNGACEEIEIQLTGNWVFTDD